MRILIVGLGLMGGSYAMGLTKASHEVYATDINIESIKYAKDKKIIIDGSTDPKDFIENVDMVIIGLYPNNIIKFLEEYNKYFKEGQIITDLCGIKTYFLNKAQEIVLKAEYISHHPMAGREKSGVEYANTEMFEKANFLITPTDKNTTKAIDALKFIGRDLKFGRISVVTPKHHDEIIAYTSQLTHAIAVALVNSDRSNDSKDFVGDSYRDLTRIAKINEELWSELFFNNKEALMEKIRAFEEELDEIKKALNDDDKELLKEKFRSSTKHRKEME